MFGFFSRKKEEENEKENKEKETEEFQRENKEIIALSVSSKEDLKEALDEFKKGIPTLIGLQGFKKNGLGTTKSLVEELLSFTKKRRGNILGVGKDYLLLTPEHYTLRVQEF
ncbi:MAG: cell division protein SepF [Candidatus Thorarchaeota archaeon]|nr:cell division protein SepF [Candidatus Thorarchaeota archaeon]